MKIKKLQTLSILQKITDKTISDIKYFKTEYGKDRMKYILLGIAREHKNLKIF